MHHPTPSQSKVPDQFYLDFSSLKANRLGDPSQRLVEVWWPQGAKPDDLPLLVCLASYLNSGPSLTGWRAFGETLPARLDRLHHQGAIAGCVVVFIDSYSRLGGTQYVNSPIIGNWPSALADDLVPAIEARYHCGGAGRRGLFGHSSGGYGALYNLAMRPDIWSAAASHAGDCGFDLVYRAELPTTLRALSRYNFDIPKFLDLFWQQEKPNSADITALMMLAMAASYDPSDNRLDPLGLRLPVTTDTCTLLPERWAQWLTYDPLHFMNGYSHSACPPRALYFDCGRSDEYNILYGSRQLSKNLARAGIQHHFEEFDGTHAPIGPRYEISLPILINALTENQAG